MEIPLEYYTERGQQIPGPSWTGDELASMDHDEIEVIQLAMENSRWEQIHVECTRLEREVCRLQDLLLDNDIDPIQDKEDN